MPPALTDAATDVPDVADADADASPDAGHEMSRHPGQQVDIEAVRAHVHGLRRPTQEEPLGAPPDGAGDDRVELGRRVEEPRHVTHDDEVVDAPDGHARRGVLGLPRHGAPTRSTVPPPGPRIATTHFYRGDACA